MPRPRITLEEYEQVPLMAVAALVGEWRQAYDHAVATEVGPLQTLEVLTHLGDAVEAWRRRRGLPVHMHPAAVVADARKYATDNPGALAAFDQLASSARRFMSMIDEED